MIYKHFKLLCIFVLYSNIIITESLYDQLIPELTQNINIENPKESDQFFIHACRAHSQGGTKFAPTGTELLQAIKSVEMFVTILPKYARTLTNSGYIAMARLCAQMTDNPETLANKVIVQKYFDQNPQIVKSLNQIIQYSIHAEHKFFELFKQLSTEEQEELDKIQKQLYFSNLGLNRFNETASALEIGPRINQLHTAAWCLIPALIASTVHHQVNYWNTRLELADQATNLNYAIENKKEYPSTKEYADHITKYERQINFDKKHGWYTQSDENNLETLKKYQNFNIDTLEKDLTIAQKASENHNKTSNTTAPIILRKIQDELQKIDISKLTADEKNILQINTDSPLDLVTFITTHRKRFLSAWIKTASKEGLYNLPTFTYDAIIKFPQYFAKKVYNDVVHLAKYNEYKDFFINKGTDKDSMNHKIFAAIGTSLEYSMIVAGLSIYPGLLYWRYKSTKNLLDLIHEKQQDLIATAHLIKSMKMLNKVIKSDATLTCAMSQELQKLSELFDTQSKTTSADLKKLVHLLLSPSFKGDGSYFLSQEGKILATHHLLTRIKNELVPYLEIFGQVDAHLAIAKLYKEFTNHSKVQFCFPEFVENINPILEADAYWHPLIDTDKVVTNSLKMNDHTANLIITGPNAGGKTTSLMSLIINIIFAQSFGIAPSSSLRLTPFAKIHSYLDITTNLQEGFSLFAAEIDRAKKLKTSILACLPGQKTFTIIDEIFSGTDPKVASDVGFTFATQLGEMNHSMTIITTHFPALTNLEEKTGRYVNYKVADATIHANGSITYPFKLVQGISSQNVAAQILHNQGII